MTDKTVIENIGYNNVAELEAKIILHQEALISQYEKYVPKTVLQEYLPPEKYITVNDDKDSYPFDLKLPDPPEYHKIDGFGLPADQQYFRTQVVPMKLVELVKNCNTYFDVVDKLDRNRRVYKDEIRWIQMQWHYRINGYFFYNRGVPTYIDGWHFYYLNYWNLEESVGLPSFTYRDRIFFLFARYCATTTEAPFFYRVCINEDKEDQEPEYWYFSTHEEANEYNAKNELNTVIEEGFWLINYKHRTVYGFNYPKHRREGATYKGACIHTEIISRSKEIEGLLVSMDGERAADAFMKKYKMPMRKMAFFFKPHISSRLTTQIGGIRFDVNTTQDSKKLITNNEFLMSGMDFQTSSGELKSDGSKFYFVHSDEIGKGNKMTPYDCRIRHDVLMKTVAQKPDIHGLMINTSTSDDTKGDFGRNYRDLCMDSHWHMRNYAEGTTSSGLLNLFIPAYVNMSLAMTDKYGMPIIGKLTKEEQQETGSRVGADLQIKASLAQRVGERHYHYMREYPTELRHCFMASADDSKFDLLKLSERLSQLDMMVNPPVRRGNFRWVAGWGSTVEFVDDNKGKFYLSYVPAKPNNLVQERGKLVAGNKDIFVSASDPFHFDTTRAKRKSKGAGAVYMKRNKDIDPDTKDPKDWISYRFVCTYCNDVPTDEYVEDMLMMSIYFGCEHFTEMNIETVHKYFNNNKYRGLLGYLYKEGIKDKLPGYYMQAALKERLFKLTKIKIERNIEHELHKDLLQEWVDIEGLGQMRDYDLFAAAGGCMLADYYSKEGAANLKLDTGNVYDEDLVNYVEGLYVGG